MYVRDSIKCKRGVDLKIPGLEAILAENVVQSKTSTC